MNTVNPQQWPAQYQKYLHQIAMNRVNDHERASDLVQDTFLAGLEQLPHFKGNSTERTWLTSILLHKIIDFYRKRYLEKEKKPNVINAHLIQQARISNEEMVIQKEFAASFQLKLNRLPKLWSAAFKLKYLDGASTDLICKQLGITSNNLWTITHRSKLQLRGYLQKAG